MYYGGKYFGSKLQSQERVWLYAYGDEFVSFTGGWEITGVNISKQSNHFLFTTGSPVGRRISTVNKINFYQPDRLHITLEVNNTSVPSSGFNAFKTDNSVLGNRLKNTILAARYPASEFQPNVVKTIMFYDTDSFLEVLSLVNNNETWKVYEVYIDRYY